jgi:hypothetical protein
MRTVTWKSILDGVCTRPGITVPATDAGKDGLLEFIGSRLRDAWEFFAWPELELTEYRYFRDVWAASPGTYAEGDEVFSVDTQSYWRATGATTGVDIPGEFGANGTLLAGVGESLAYSDDGDYIVYTGTGNVESKWVELVRFRKTVPYQQTGQNELGAVLGAYTDDPRKERKALRVPYSLRGEGVELLANYGHVGMWLDFRQAAPNVAPKVYSASPAYAVGEAVYIEPAAWDVILTTTPGDTPTSAPTKFQAKPMPAWLSPAIKAGAYSDLLAADG